MTCHLCFLGMIHITTIDLYYFHVPISPTTWDVADAAATPLFFPCFSFLDLFCLFFFSLLSFLWVSVLGCFWLTVVRCFFFFAG